MSSPSRSTKLIGLEAMRGVASVIVLFHHFLLAFFFELHGYGSGVLDGTPISVLFNGEGAVVFFFVLSGYVLPRKFYQTQQLRELAISVIKRVPRLAGPVLLSVLFGYVLILFGAYSCQTVGPLTSSPWLTACANSDILTGRIPSGILSAIWQGGVRTFLNGEHGYNTNLWSMQPEFYGSLVAYGIAPLLFIYGRKIVVAVALILALTLSLFLPTKFFLYLSCFVSGAALSSLKLAYIPKIRPMLALLVLPIFFGLGMSLPGFLPLIAYQIGAVILIAMTITNEKIDRMLIGKTGILLGKISFPLYLAHTLIILSVCSLIYNSFYLIYGSGIAALLAFLALIITLIPLLALYVRFDDWWLTQIAILTSYIKGRSVRVPFLVALLVLMLTYLAPTQPPRYSYIEAPYTDLRGRSQEDCPDHGTFIIALGQSNAANSITGSTKAPSSKQTFSLYQGNCYQLADPLPGATHNKGSLWSLFADQLAEHTHLPVTVLASASGNSAVAEWTDGRYPYLIRLREQLSRAPIQYKNQIPVIFWHQGEADSALGTSGSNYAASLNLLFDRIATTLHEMGFRHPPRFMLFQASHCGPFESADIRAAQEMVAHQRYDAELVMNTDDLSSDARQKDDCHLNTNGQKHIVETLMQRNYPFTP